MKLSVVIPSHNRPDLLRACLGSVLRHAPEGTEVLVVDDASPDSCIREAANSFPEVKCRRLERRSGFCVAANTGIRASTGDIVELLNDDTVVESGWASAALESFKDVAVGAVAPLVLIGPEGTRVDSAGDRYYLGGVAVKRGHRQPLGVEHLQPRRVFGASASSAFYRRAALERVGAFPDHFGAYFEDVDLAFRLQRAGYRTHFEPRSRVLHRGSASYGRPRRRLLEQQSRNEERVFWRNLPARALLRALPRHLAVLLGKAWRRWHEGTLAPFVCGRFQLLGEVPEILRHRRALERSGAAREISAWMVEEHYWS